MLKTVDTPALAKVRFIAPMKLAFICAKGPYVRSVAEAWSQMFNWLDNRGHMASTGTGYGLAHDDPQTTLSSKIRYDAAVQIPPTWSEEDLAFVHVRTFKGGSYTVQRYVGPYSSVGRMISQTRRDVLPRSGLVLDRVRPVLCIYHSNPRHVSPEDHETDVCLPVMTERRTIPRD